MVDYESKNHQLDDQAYVLVYSYVDYSTSSPSNKRGIYLKRRLRGIFSHCGILVMI